MITLIKLVMVVAVVAAAVLVDIVVVVVAAAAALVEVVMVVVVTVAGVGSGCCVCRVEGDNEIARSASAPLFLYLSCGYHVLLQQVTTNISSCLPRQ